VSKGRAYTVWDEDAARPWLLRLARFHPDIVKDFRTGDVLTLVKFGRVDDAGIRPAYFPESLVGEGGEGFTEGELLPGLHQDTRPGSLHVAIK
jgi:hypothetical protein